MMLEQELALLGYAEICERRLRRPRLLRRGRSISKMPTNTAERWSRSTRPAPASNMKTRMRRPPRTKAVQNRASSTSRSWE